MGAQLIRTLKATSLGLGAIRRTMRGKRPRTVSGAMGLWCSGTSFEVRESVARCEAVWPPITSSGSLRRSSPRFGAWWS